MARLLIDMLYQNREKKRFELHEFVVMPDHFHLLITPDYEISLEKAVQFIKGGFSFRAKGELGFNGEIWQEGFTLRRIENSLDYERHREYIWQNPVKRGLCLSSEEFPYLRGTPSSCWIQFRQG
jgi:putative transposase